MTARPPATTTFVPTRSARRADSGDVMPITTANGSVWTPADSVS